MGLAALLRKWWRRLFTQRVVVVRVIRVLPPPVEPIVTRLSAIIRAMVTRSWVGRVYSLTVPDDKGMVKAMIEYKPSKDSIFHDHVFVHLTPEEAQVVRTGDRVTVKVAIGEPVATEDETGKALKLLERAVNG